MIRTIRLLQLRRLRQHPLRAVIACVSIAAGSALAVSLVVVVTSVNRSYDDFGTKAAGRAAFRVVGATSAGGLDERVLTKVERVTGVAAAVPVVQAVTLARPNPGPPLPTLVLGVDCRATAIFGDVPCDPEALARARDTDPPLVSPAVLEKANIMAELRTSTGRVPLANAVKVEQLGRLGGGRVALFPLRVAQRLFSRAGLLDAIYVVPQRGENLDALQKRLRTAVGPWNGVLPASAPPAAGRLVVDAFVPLFSILAVLGLGIGAVLVYNTVALSMEERRLQLAIVSALGGTRRTVMMGALTEAGGLGLIGGLLGVPGGFLLAHPTVDSLGRFTENLVALPLRVHVSAAPVVAGAVIGTSMSLVGAGLAARRALRIDISAELSNRELRAQRGSGRLLVRALVLTAIALVGMGMCEVAQLNGALATWQPSAAMVGIGICTLAFTLATGAWGPLVVRWALGSVRRAPAPARLAMANLVREPGRTGVMVVAVGSAVGMAFMLASFTTAISHGIRHGVTRGLAGKVRVSTAPPTNTVNLDARLDSKIVDGVRRVAGVARVDRGASVMTGARTGEVVGVVAFEHPTMPLKLISGSKDVTRFERGDGVMVGAGFARRRHLRPGSMFSLPTPTGFMRARVLGIWQDGDFTGNVVTVPMSTMERAWGARSPLEVYAQPQRGVSPETVRRRILSAGLDRDLRAETAEELARIFSGDIGKQLAAFWAAQRALVVMAFVAVLSTLLLVGVQRRRELATLVAVGMESGQLARMVVLEAGVVAAVGAVIGPLAGLGMFEASRQVVPIFIGFHDPFRLDLSAWFLYAPVTVAVVLAASALPGWRSSHLEVVPALQYE